ncbi:MAG: hypothetical protein QW331_03265 [Candidatus Woesearchaeota archaeon]
MKLEIIKKYENPMLKRFEVEGRLIFDNSTPKKEEVKKAVAQTIKCDENLTAVKHIYSEFGKKEAIIKAYCYQDESTFKLLEVKKENKTAQPAAEKKEVAT